MSYHQIALTVPTARNRSAVFRITLPLAMAATFLVACSGDDSVTPPAHEHTLATVSVAPANLTLHIGEETTLNSVSKCGCGAVINPALTWTSSDGGVISITAPGRVKALALGSATVTAGSGGITDAATVVVEPVGTAVGSAGGIVVSADGNATLEIPAGALTTLTDVVIEPVSATMFAGDPLYIAGTGYQLKPDGLQLQERAQLRIAFNANLLPPGTFAEQLRLRERDRTQNQWRETEQNQLANPVMAGEIERFGVFAVVVQPATGTMIGPNGGTVVSGDGNVELVIPAGALATPTDVVIQPVDAAMFGNDPQYIAGTGYQLMPDGLQLQEQAQLRIRFNPVLLPPNCTQDQLRLRERDRDQDQWRETQQHQLMNQQVAGNITQFGVFALVAQQNGSATIGPAGGTLVSVDGNAELIIPAGALAAPVQVTIEKVDDADVGAAPLLRSTSLRVLYATADGQYLPGSGYEIRPTGQQLQFPAQLRIHFDPANLPNGVEPQHLRIRQRDRVQNRWQDPTQCTLSQNLVQTLVSSFGTFGIVASVDDGGTPVPASIAISPSVVNVEEGDVIQMSAEVLDTDGNVMNVPITWSSSNTAVVTVDDTGLATAVAEGTAVITAQANGLQGNAGVNVSKKGAAVASVAIVPSSTTVIIGSTVQLAAEVRDADGNLLTRTVSWQSSATTIATVNNGLVTGVAVGSAVITASAQNISGTADVTVSPPVSSVVIADIGNSPLEPGQTLQLVATAYNINGQPVSANFTWTSSSDAIATVDATGLVTAVASGTATITAAVGTASASVDIRVVGESTSETGNNLSRPIIFADGVGLTGAAVSSDPGIRPTDPAIVVDSLPFWWSGNVSDYLLNNVAYYTQGTANTWRPEYVDGTGQPSYDADIDWGDALTSRSMSVDRPIRVEQALYDASGATMLGFNMTSLYGTDKDEMFGADGSTSLMTPIIYTAGAQLTVEKLNSSGGSPVATVVDETATAEINISGGVVWGYNLMLKNWTPPAGMTQDGYYRITFRLATGANVRLVSSPDAGATVAPTYSTFEIYVAP